MSRFFMVHCVDLFEGLEWRQANGISNF